MSDDIRYTSPKEKAAELADAADVFLSYKEKKGYLLSVPIGALLGAEIGAKGAPEGKKLKRGLIGAGIGALGGAAGGALLDVAAGRSLSKAVKTKQQYLKKLEEVALPPRPPKPLKASEKAKNLGWKVLEGGKGKEKKAFLGPVRSVAQRAGTALGRHPALASSLKGAAEWGAAGGVGGALFAPEGKRGRSILKGMAAGAAGGAAAPVAGRAMHKFLHPAVKAVKTAAPVVPPPEIMRQFERRSRRKYSPKRTPTVKQDVKGALETLKDKVLGFRRARQEIAIDPSSFLEKDAINFKALKKVLPRAATDPGSLAIVGGTAALFGVSNYLKSRPRKELGGKSKMQVKYEDIVKAQEAVGPKKDDKLSKKLHRRLNVFRRDVAQDFAEHPRAAGVTTAALGAMVGGLAGAGYARIMRGGK
jgi:hypothetical protein